MTKTGSSPRMRGAQQAQGGLDPTARIIPADAGSTADTNGFSAQNADHPRGCGEHADSYAAIMPALGSSPRMRGARCFVLYFERLGGIIPADAGSTHSWL